MRTATPLLPIACSLFVLLPFAGHAQTYERMYGGPAIDGALAAFRTADGGYLNAGVTRGFGAVGEDVYVVRTDSTGALLWTRTYGGPGDERALAAASTNDGGAVLCGTTTSYGNGSTDLLLLRTDAAGDTLWCRTYGDAVANGGAAVLQADDGGFLACGWHGELFGNGTDLYLVRTDAVGDTLWTRCLGGQYGEAGVAVQATNDGAYMIAGNTASFSAGLKDLYLLKVDDNGQVLFSRTYGGPGMDIAGALIPTSDGGWLIGASTETYWVAGRGVYLVRTDAVGDTLWTRAYDTGGLYGGLAYALCESATGDFLVGGESVDLKVNGTGALQWARSFVLGTTPVHSYCEALVDGGFLLSGYCGPNGLGLGAGDVHQVRIDASGGSNCTVIPFPQTETLCPTVVGSPSTMVHQRTTVVSPAALSIGTGGTEALLCLSTNVDQAPQKAPITVHPNPSTGQFDVRIQPSATRAGFAVFDGRGACVMRGSFFGPMGAIDLSGVAPGPYTLLIQLDALLHRSVLIVEH